MIESYRAISIIPGIVATIIFSIVMGYFIYRRRYSIVAFLCIFYLHSIYFTVTIYAGVKGYYAKWGLHTIILLGWTFLATFRWVKMDSLRKKAPIFFGLLFIGSAMISALLCKTTGEAALRAATFLPLLTLAYIVIPAGSLEERLTSLFMAMLVLDAIIVLVSGLGLVYPGFYLAGRFRGIFRLPTFMGIFAYSILILGVAKKTTRAKRSPFLLLLIILGLLMVVLTRSRAAYLAAAMGVLTVLYLTNRRAFWICAVLLCWVVTISGLLFVNWEHVLAGTLRGGSVDEILSIRLYYMERAWHFFKQSPIFGIGMGTIPEGVKVISRSGMPFASSIERVTNQAGYHLLLVETGALGLGLYLAWLFTSFFIGWRQVKSYAENRELYGLMVGCLGLFVAYAAHGIFEDFPAGAANIVSICMWAMAGIFALMGGRIGAITAEREGREASEDTLLERQASAMTSAAPRRGFGKG